MTQNINGLTKPAGNGSTFQTNQPAVDHQETKQTNTIVPAEPAKEEKATEVKNTSPAEAVELSRPGHPEFRPHAFVVMPFGKKKGAGDITYDFNLIYQTLIKPALEQAGFEPFRADEETASGDILTDMFQELLLADLVLCDLSIDNANAFYELGIRHALRRRGVMHIQAGRAYMPFDIFNVRTLPYHVTSDGIPDEAYLKTDIAAIVRMARDTWASDRDAVHSPVFNLLTGLKEPDRKSLRTSLTTRFWREYDEWKERITVAKRQQRIGDILLLTEEIRNPMFKEEAFGEAAKALASMGRYELALDQYHKGLEVNPKNEDFRRQESFLLNRLGRVDEAITKIESLIADLPDDSEAIAYLGRIYKETWLNSWKDIKDKDKRVKVAFDSSHWLVKSIDAYLKGYRADVRNYYPGVNAFTLSMIAVHIADLFSDRKNPDPDIKRIREGIDELRGSLTFTLEAKSVADNANYWTLVSLADLYLLTENNIASVARAYRKALTGSRRDISSLNSSISQLNILLALGVREAYVQCGLQTLTDEILRTDKDVLQSSKSKVKKQTGRVFLFSGYMVDYEGKEHKTFPMDKERGIRADIKERLKKFGANPNDLGYTAGLSAGSEIIFAEVCAEIGIPVRVYLPLTESAYIREFVSPGGDSWVDRFYAIRDHPLVDEHYQNERVGLADADDDPSERNNRWALYSSLVRGVDKVKLLALWNGRSGIMKDKDACIVKHMVDFARENGVAVELINTSKYIHGEVAGGHDGLPEISIAAGSMVSEVKPKVKPKRKKK